ncbi:pyrroloquinoline-quinone synthase PqqC [Coralloluteibacterium stylophorae]|uniref:Pyrroloquinoline-quinone synthase n=1 Tax=Coralloluteibacterium stylophorae TaxID=1776034 RepID=A0AAP2C975_9GAMM|nr:pyrroloquinoline-quinone synthase PqqC [Coralloluteibacterium stylophorae]
MNAALASTTVAAGFEARLRDAGRAYHIHHPFNRMLNEGRASREQIRGWVANRYYYQITIPRKDAAILANCPDRELRRQWMQRILDHDGHGEDAGGIEAWLRLGEAVGLARAEIVDLRHVIPGLRFAVDAYLDFARRAPWQEGMCSSLTELFAPKIHKERLATWPQHYPWIESDGLQYFRNRVSQARIDVDLALAVTLGHFVTAEQQERALSILRFKLDILWTMNDAMALKYGVAEAA